MDTKGQAGGQGHGRNKEQVYDEEIFPLMVQILDICKRERVAMLASFAIPTPEHRSLRCTSYLLGDEYLADAMATDDYFAAKLILEEGFVAYTRRAR